MKLLNLFAQDETLNLPTVTQRNNNVLPEVAATESNVQSGLAIVFGLIAAAAVLVIIVAAINMANSEGNPDNIARSKKTIVYALIGMVIALMAEFIVLTVVGRL